jgi:hypothetical protein
MVPRIVARRVLPERPRSWAGLLTSAQWECLRPAFVVDGRLQSECRVVLQRLPARERAAFVVELAAELDDDRNPPQALGLAVEAAARRALNRRGRALLVARPRRRA